MSIPALYRTWRKKLKELMVDRRYGEARLRNTTHLVVGMYRKQSVHLSEIACKIPDPIQKLSITRRMRRLLAGEAIDARAWYEPIAKRVLQAASVSGEVRLIVDTTKVTAHKRLLMVAVAYHRRAIPIAWSWVSHHRGHSTSRVQLELYNYIQGLLPDGVSVLLVGDSEFGHTPVLRQLDKWEWCYVLRQRGSYRFGMVGCAHLARLDDIDLAPGDLFVLGDVTITASNPTSTHIILYWKANEKEPWRLATNIPCVMTALKAYQKRMWIEEMFGDFKGNGFDLELSRLRHIDRLSRLTLLVCLLYIWLVSVGEDLILTQRTAWVDRSDRRDLSIFRLGLDFVERCLTLGHSPPPFALPTFSLNLSGA